MSSSPICVIRKYKFGDEIAIKNIITEVTMEKVNRFYFGVIFSQALPQISVAFVGVLFIIFGVPLQYSLIAIPITLLFLYSMVWMVHWIKANELDKDLNNIDVNYMGDPTTCFFVAEVYSKSSEQLAHLIEKVKKVEYEFVTEKEFGIKTFNLAGRKPVIAGCIGVTKSLLDKNSAWLRRMGVTLAFRRRQIARELLITTMKFCKEQRYFGIELTTTEHHQEARNLFSQEGFDTISIGYRSFFLFDSCQQIHLHKCLGKSQDISTDELDKAESQI